MRPDVRVGIVSFNTAALLDQCLAALPAALDDLVAEVVVVDNASADDSVAVARSRRALDLTVVAGETNIGYARAMNRALAGTTADVVVALNPDTEPQPGSLARLVRAAAADPEVGLAVPRLRNVDGSLQHSVHRFPSVAQALVMGFVPPRLRAARGHAIGRRWWLEGHAAHDEPAAIDWATGAVHAIRRSALADPDHAYTERWFMYGEDLELCWRLVQDGWRVVLAPDAEVVHVGNVAGAEHWGDARDDRWIASLYDWYGHARGAGRARLHAIATLGGLTAKWCVRRAAGDETESRRLVRLIRTYGRHAATRHNGW